MNKTNTSFASLLTSLVVLVVSHAPATAAEIEVDTVVLQLMAEANVPAQEAGVLMKLGVREGSKVERGEVLGQIDDRLVRLAEQTAAMQRDL